MEIKLEKVLTDFLDYELECLLELDDEDSSFFKCESPIEKLMYLSLKKFFERFEYFIDEYILTIDCQEKIGTSNYRADIVISFANVEKRVIHLYAIECDGHEFHEKTKEQVKRDRSRERYMMKEGYKVIRFSGSEIVEGASECACEVWNIIKRDFKMFKDLSC